MKRRAFTHLWPLLLSLPSSIMATPVLATARHPFSVGAQEGSAAGVGRFGAWLLAQQTEFNTILRTSLVDAPHHYSALFILLGASFAYGVFHAAGPGHGKAVITAYTLANETALRRGVLLAALAALLQAIVAIALTSIAGLVFRATATSMTAAAEYLELAAYAAIIILGLWLVWSKGRLLYAALRPLTPTSRFECAETVGADQTCQQCGHAHMPDPSLLGARFSWRTALAAICAAGLRPCSSALLIMIYALANDLYPYGVAATLAISAGVATATGTLAAAAVYAQNFIMRIGAGRHQRLSVLLAGMQLLAAFIVLLFGLTLFIGYFHTTMSTW